MKLKAKELNNWTKEKRDEEMLKEAMR